MDIGILVATINGQPGTETHPNNGQTYLDFATNKQINTGVPLSFWYSATGHANEDILMFHGGFFSSLRVSISNPYITDLGNTLGALDPLPLQSFKQCAQGDMQNGTCPIKTDILNRTGNSVTWTVSLLDRQNGNVLLSNTGQFSAVSNTVSLYIPPNTQFFPTYILDVKVQDDVTHWYTERQAYVTSGGIASILVPLFGCAIGVSGC